MAKLYILRAAIDAGQVTLAVTLVLASLLSYYYYLRVVWKMYFEEGADHAVASTSGSFRLGAALCAAGVLLLGLLPGPVLRGFERAGSDIVGGTAATATIQAPRPDAPANPSAGGPAP